MLKHFVLVSLLGGNIRTEVPQAVIDAWETGFQKLLNLECEYTNVTRYRDDNNKGAWTVKPVKDIVYSGTNQKRLFISRSRLYDGGAEDDRTILSSRGLFAVLKGRKGERYKLYSLKAPSAVDDELAHVLSIRSRVPAFAYSYSGYTIKEYCCGPDFHLDAVEHISPTEVIFRVSATGNPTGKGGHRPHAKYKIICDPTQAWVRTSFELTTHNEQTTIIQKYRGLLEGRWPLLAEFSTSRTENGKRVSESKGIVHYIGPSRRKEAEFTPEYYGLPSTIFDQISGPAPKPWWWTYGLWGGIGVGLLFIAGWLWRRSTVARHG
jgi:hypothetical protein